MGKKGGEGKKENPYSFVLGHGKKKKKKQAPDGPAQRERKERGLVVLFLRKGGERRGGPSRMGRGGKRKEALPRHLFPDQKKRERGKGESTLSPS